MKHYYIPLDILNKFEQNKGKIEITEEALQCLLDKAYDDGFSDGFNSGYTSKDFIRDIIYDNYYDSKQPLDWSTENTNIYTVHCDAAVEKEGI